MASLPLICRVASKPYRSALLLFKLVRAYRPERCLELGTCLGISAAYQTAALELNGAGRLVTLEGDGARADLARTHLKDLGFERFQVVTGRFQDTLDDVLEMHSPVDFAFIDGHHEERATVSYFEAIRPRLSDGAVVVLDDISWSAGMKRAWDVVRHHPNVKAAVDLYGVGLCLYAESMVDTRAFYRIAL